MNKEDRAEMRELLIDVLSAHTAEVDGKFELIKQELEQIKTQTTKTNGRVTKHDTELQAISLSTANRNGMYRLIIIAATTIAATSAIVIPILQLILK